jgi:hypothetical protein
VVCPVSHVDRIYEYADKNQNKILQLDELSWLMERMGDPKASEPAAAKLMERMTGSSDPGGGVTIEQFKEWCLARQPSASMSISIFGLQTFGLIGRRVEYFGVFELFNFNAEAVVGECLVPLSSFGQQMVVNVIPVGAMLFVFGICAGLKVVKGLNVQWHHVHRALASILLFSFAPITRSCFSMLLCREAAGKNYLAHDMSIECTVQRHLLTFAAAY